MRFRFYLSAGIAALLLAGALTLAGGAGLAAAAEQELAGPALPVLRLLYLNDWHGHLEPYRREERELGGAARLSTLLQRRRALAAEENVDTLLLLAGDVLQGTPMSTVFRGRPDFELLNRFGLDAMCLGNHEFDFGLEVLRQRVSEARFPVLAANVLRTDGIPLVGLSTTLRTKLHGLSVAVLGLTTAETPDVSLARNVEGLRFDDPWATAARLVPSLAATHDLVVLLSHCGEAVDRRLATIPGVGAVIGGHDQRLLEPPPWVGDVPVVQAFEWGEWLGELDVVRVEAGLRAVANRYLAVDAALPADPEVEAFVAGFRSRLGGELQEVLTVATVPFEGERAVIRSRETNLGDLVADVVRETTGAEVALINGGSIRASIDLGPVTLEEVMQALPFESELVVVELTGRQLAAVLDRSISLAGNEEGGFLQVSGVRWEAGSAETATIRVGDARLQPDRRYTVAMTDFLAGGGDGYHELRELPARRTGFLLTAALVSWMRDRAELGANADGRLGEPRLEKPAP